MILAGFRIFYKRRTNVESTILSAINDKYVGFYYPPPNSCIRSLFTYTWIFTIDFEIIFQINAKKLNAYGFKAINHYKPLNVSDVQNIIHEFNINIVCRGIIKNNTNLIVLKSI
jgi:hypothetical protein